MSADFIGFGTVDMYNSYLTWTPWSVMFTRLQTAHLELTWIILQHSQFSFYVVSILSLTNFSFYKVRVMWYLAATDSYNNSYDIKWYKIALICSMVLWYNNMVPVIFHTNCRTINCAFWNYMMLYPWIFSSHKIFHCMFPSIHAPCKPFQNFHTFTHFILNSNGSSTNTTFYEFPIMIMQLLCYKIIVRREI
jgi:hypothetical protein